MDPEFENVECDFAQRRDELFATVYDFSLDEFERKMDALVLEANQKLTARPELQLEIKRRGAETTVHAAILQTVETPLIESRYQRLETLGFTDNYQQLFYCLIVAQSLIANNETKKASLLLRRTSESISQEVDSETRPLLKQIKELLHRCG